jgi:hypothetical protein
VKHFSCAVAVSTVFYFFGMPIIVGIAYCAGVLSTVIFDRISA